MGDPLIFIRAIHFAATLTLAGALIFAVAVVGPIMRPMERGGEALRARLLRIAWWSFAAALISGVAWLVVVAVLMQTPWNPWQAASHPEAPASSSKGVAS